MRHRLKITCLAICALAFGAVFSSAQAAWPEKPIRWIVPFPAGGAVDILSRTIAPELSKVLGQQIVIENVSGAGGRIGSLQIAKAKPDGYTVGLAHAGPLAIDYALYKSMPYKSPDDFTMIALMGGQQNCIVVNPSSDIHSVKDLLAKTKAHPNKVKLGSGGTGTGSYLGAELFMSKTGVKFLHVPYKGNAPAVRALLAGEVEVMFPSIRSVLGHIQAGRLRAIAVTTEESVPALPGVEPVAKTVPDCCSSVWFGLMGPAGLPKDVVTTLSAAIQKVVLNDKFKQQMYKKGLTLKGSTPQGLHDYVIAQKALWKKIAKEAGLKPR